MGREEAVFKLGKAALVNKGGLGNDAKDMEEDNGGKTPGHQVL